MAIRRMKRLLRFWCPYGILGYILIIATKYVVQHVTQSYQSYVHQHSFVVEQALIDQINSSMAHHTDQPKLIYAVTKMWQELEWSDLLKFDNCGYNNCILKNASQFTHVEEADIVMFAAVKYTKQFATLPWEIRQHQYWFIMTIESGIYQKHKFPRTFNNQFNGSVMYRKDATVYYPFGRIRRNKLKRGLRNFAQGKLKGAFAYVSRCSSRGYSRLDIMNILALYIDVDIYSSTCHGPHVFKPLCPRLASGSNPDCETKAHGPYRFFLAFENSLCKDYITEKFWDRLQSSSYFLPIAMGGLTVEEYTSVAPPDSFLHVYNFTSVHKLGEYLKYLMENDEMYNKYHQWRCGYEISTKTNDAACQLCKIANEKPVLPAISDIAEWRNNFTLCRKYMLK